MFDDLDLPAPTTADSAGRLEAGERPEALSPPPPAAADSLDKRIEDLRQAGKNRSKRSKFYSILALLFFLVFAGSAVYAGVLYWEEIRGYFFINKSDLAGEIIACPLDTQECPDGTFVSRVPPDCEFKKCPPAAAAECVREGEKINTNTTAETKNCCAGLSAWPAFLILEDECQRISGEEVCINCPDGDCGAGENKCNCSEDCSPDAGGEAAATSSPVNKCELEPDPGPCRAKFTGYYYDWQDGACREFTWGGCEGLVPFNSLEKCREECEDISSTTKFFVSDIATSSDKIITEIDTSNWQIYRDEELGFVIKYPLEWHIDEVRSNRESSGSDVVFDTGNPAIHEGIKVDYTTQTLDEWLKSWPDKSVISTTSELSIDNQKAIRIDTTEMGLKRIAIKYGDRIYDITTNGLMIDNEMLATFKFIKDSDNDGLFDDKEAEYGTDMNNPDTDGDGYTDGDEVKNGYNPNGEGTLK